MIKHRGFVFCVLLLSALTSTALSAQKNSIKNQTGCITLAWSADTEAMQNMLYHVEAALKPEGLCAHFKQLPYNRATRALREGSIDGEIGRVADYQTVVSDAAIRIDEPLAAGRGYLLAKDPEVSGLDDFTGIIGIRRGVLWQTDILKPGQQSIAVETGDALVKILASNRVQGVFLSQYDLERHPVLHNYKPIKVYETTIHVYLHQARSDLAGALSRALRTYKTDGHDFISKPPVP